MAVPLAKGAFALLRLYQHSRHDPDCPSDAEIAAWAESWAAKPIRFVYESGPCGFQLARDMRSLGHDCDVIAVTSIPRSSQDRAFKDDRRDAEDLLHAVISPKSKCNSALRLTAHRFRSSLPGSPHAMVDIAHRGTLTSQPSSR